MTTRSKQHTCVFGLSWGDEGKGKVVDLLCPAFDVVVRYNGGANAGHTVCVGDQTFALHLLPAGVLHEHVTGVIGPGVVVDPGTLLSEIDDLAAQGIDVSGRLKISERVHLVLAYHKLEDQLSERSASNRTRLGTTARGIGPCYADKMKRASAIRFADILFDDNMEERVRRIVAERMVMLAAMYGEEAKLDVDAVLADLKKARDHLGPYVCDTNDFLFNVIDAGRTVLFEGANGMLLDVDYGTYPFVTSSSTGPHGIWPGTGIPASRITRLVGTAKAYATRVGSGPFVSELDNEIGDRIRRCGKEFGTTTGRPRRCGWFDVVSCVYAARLTSVTDIALMHLDTLSGLDQIGLCVAYRADGKTFTTVPANTRLLERAEAVIEFLPGWREDLGAARRFEDLPPAAQAYVERIETLVGVPVSIIGVGAERSQTIIRGRMSSVIEMRESSAV